MTEVSEEPILLIGGMLLVASLVAMLSRRLKLPYSVGLVAAGIALAIAPLRLELELSRELIFMVFLPPLVFEAALQLEWKSFRREMPLTVLLAFVGVAIAAGVVAGGTHFVLGWSWIGAGLFGVLIAATDPVSVIAAFREMKVEHRLSMIVESESLLNDGVAAVGFGILVAIALGGSGTPGAIGLSFLWTVFGGIAAGAIVAGALLLIAWRTEDHLVEITLTTIIAYGSFLFAEHIGTSGVLATLTAGMMVSGLGWKGPISAGGRGHVRSWWDYAAFLANSIIFILIGGHEAAQPLISYAWPAAVAVGLVMLGRALAIYPLCGAMSFTALRVPPAYQHILFWGGLRGALALALALALPESVPERGQIVVVAFAVVAFSIFVQGISMPLLIRRLRVARSEPEDAPSG